MRIEFISPCRDSLSWTQARLRIGSAADNDLVLAVGQAAPRHLLFESDARGWVLWVVPGAPHVYVNARPVRELALLRPGDVVSLGDCRLLLCADEAPDRRRLPQAVADQAHCTVALRAVAGPMSGKVVAVHEYLELGPRGRYPLELPRGESATLRIGWRDGRLTLAVLEPSARHGLRVNGNLVTDVVLQSGDQIGIGMHRFVVAAPGIKPEPEPVMPPPPAPPATAPSHAGTAWLIVTAAVLALGIALLFLVRF
ncbi:MAG: forkhead-associated protein [Xanthomonadales bacterium]|nr:forkhead-associated protein [Xanthomonadales bacterium]